VGNHGTSWGVLQLANANMSPVKYVSSSKENLRLELTRTSTRAKGY